MLCFSVLTMVIYLIHCISLCQVNCLVSLWWIHNYIYNKNECYITTVIIRIKLCNMLLLVVLQTFNVNDQLVINCNNSSGPCLNYFNVGLYVTS